MEPDGSRTEFGSPAFDDRYKGIVVDVVQGALDQGSSVLIVGLPVMQDLGHQRRRSRKEPIVRGGRRTNRFRTGALRSALEVGSRR